MSSAKERQIAEEECFPWRLTCKDYNGRFMYRDDAERWVKREGLTGCELYVVIDGEEHPASLRIK